MFETKLSGGLGNETFDELAQNFNRDDKVSRTSACFASLLYI